MSLFIGSLAFEEAGIDLLFDERLGIMAGSLLSGLLGYAILRLTLPAKSIKAERLKKTNTPIGQPPHLVTFNNLN